MANELIDGVLDIILEYEEYWCRDDNEMTANETILSNNRDSYYDDSDSASDIDSDSDDSVSTFHESDFEEDHYHDNEFDRRFCAQCRYFERQHKNYEHMIKCEWFNVI